MMKNSLSIVPDGSGIKRRKKPQCCYNFSEAFRSPQSPLLTPSSKPSLFCTTFHPALITAYPTCGFTSHFSC